MRGSLFRALAVWLNSETRGQSKVESDRELSDVDAHKIGFFKSQ
jgi:hypothetical protein